MKYVTIFSTYIPSSKEITIFEGRKPYFLNSPSSMEKQGLNAEQPYSVRL